MKALRTLLAGLLAFALTAPAFAGSMTLLGGGGAFLIPAGYLATSYPDAINMGALFTGGGSGVVTQNASKAWSYRRLADHHRFEIRDGDLWQSTERSEVSGNSTYFNNADVWMSWSTRWNGTQSGAWHVQGQFHAPDTGGTAGYSPVVALNVDGGGNLQLEANYNIGAGQVFQAFPIAGVTFTAGQIYNVVVNFKANPASPGTSYASVWINGVQRLNQTGANIGFSNDGGGGFYPKFGIYRDAAGTTTEVWDYWNFEVSTSSLAARISAPLYANPEDLATPSAASPYTLNFATNSYAYPGGTSTALFGSPGITYSNAGGGYALTSANVLTAFAPNIPRVTDRGLLIEAARTNLQVRSTSPWSGSQGGTAVTWGSDTNFDGTTQAAKFTANGASSAHLAQFTTDAVAFTIGQNYSFTAVVKPVSGSTFVQLSANSAAFSTGRFVDFNLSGAGAVGLGGAVVGTPTITALGGAQTGWYLITATFACTASTSAQPATLNFVTSNTSVYQEVNTSTAVATWGGFQVEQGNAPTSLIPTTTSTATRTDALTVTASGSPSTATVTYGAGSTATPSATSPINLGATGGGAWVGSYVTKLQVQ